MRPVPPVFGGGHLSTKALPPVGWPEQSFVLSREILKAASHEEVLATYEQMQEFGLARPPFDRMDIRVPEAVVIALCDKDGNVTGHPKEEGRWIIFRYEHGEFFALLRDSYGKWGPMVEALEEIAARDGGRPVGPSHVTFREAVAECGRSLMRLLVVLLATRNVVKERVECKTLRLGIGSRERNRYTTTLKIGTVVERGDGAPGPGAGVGRRPHLRRGHIRRQRHGPNFELVRSIWIEPVFVNADEAWVSERTAYNVSLGGRS